jgi:hypothetical protein
MRSIEVGTPRFPALNSRHELGFSMRCPVAGAVDFVGNKTFDDDKGDPSNGQINRRRLDKNVGKAGGDPLWGAKTEAKRGTVWAHWPDIMIRQARIIKLN